MESSQFDLKDVLAGQAMCHCDHPAGSHGNEADGAVETPGGSCRQEWSQPRWEATWTTTGLSIARVTQCSEAHISSPSAPAAAVGFNVGPIEFHSCFDLISFFSLILFFWNRNDYSVTVYQIHCFRVLQSSVAKNLPWVSKISIWNIEQCWNCWELGKGKLYFQ